MRQGRNKFPWRLLWVLLVASVAGIALALPMIFEVFRQQIESAPANLPLLLIIPLAVIQNTLLLSLVIGLGLHLARRLGLGAPLLESWLYREETSGRARASLAAGLLVGFGVGLILVLILLPSAAHLPGLPFARAARVALWKRVLVCFYGGIDEEVLMRLFLLTLLGWLGVRLFQKQKMRMSPVTFWIANVIVAIVFGLGHLPNAAMVMKITPAVVLLALLLNGIAALPFGYLFWKRGLETAAVAHFSADFVLYVIGPAFTKAT